MRRFSTQDIPPRAAFAVVALVLLASVVIGRENPRPAPAPLPAVRAETRPAAPQSARASAADLDLERIRRPAVEETIPELFAPRNLEQSPQAHAKPGPPAKPVAPPLPFTYLGRIADGGRNAIFLARGERTYSVSVGERIDETYRLEQATPSTLTFTYLPLGTRQSLAIPALN